MDQAVSVSSRGIGEPATCYECEQESRVLEVQEEGLLVSKCLSCGYEEREWRFGDDPEYLNGLAETYRTTSEAILKAVREKADLPTDYQKTIARQLQGLNPFFAIQYGVKALVAMSDGRTLRLHTRQSRKIINIDITYDRCLDLYNIKAYRLQNHGLDVKTIFDKQGFFFDQLDETINTIVTSYRFGG